ncbi:DUF542 domain-containing protein, partial [Pseudomonas aeruginosa]
GIDFCCGGNVSIETAANQAKRITLPELLEALEEASQLQGEGINPSYLDVLELILEKHVDPPHRYV